MLSIGADSSTQTPGVLFFWLVLTFWSRYQEFWGKSFISNITMNLEVETSQVLWYRTYDSEELIYLRKAIQSRTLQILAECRLLPKAPYFQSKHLHFPLHWRN